MQSPFFDISLTVQPGEACHALSPVQVRPLPVKPALQAHTRPVVVIVQLA